MMYGIVVKNQVPLLMTFDEGDVEYVCSSLAYALEESYKVIDFFTFYDNEEDPFEES